ncbi:hypothetical protein ACMHYB_45235 [Sorangium sp. So ce1128]
MFQKENPIITEKNNQVAKSGRKLKLNVETIRTLSQSGAVKDGKPAITAGECSWPDPERCTW